MIKGRHLVSLPVINYTNGKRLGEIKDIIYDPYNNRILGFLIEEGNWFWGARILPFDRVYHIGEGAVTVASMDAIVKTSSDQAFKELLKKQAKINGFKLLSERGKDLGTIQDLVIDPVRGRITGYEISDGIVGDLLAGRKVIPIPETITLAEDSLIISGAAEDQIIVHVEEI